MKEIGRLEEKEEVPTADEEMCVSVVANGRRGSYIMHVDVNINLLDKVYD